MEACAVHPGREAVFTCPACGRPCCDECREPAGELCAECAIAAAAKAVPPSRAERRAPRAPRRTRAGLLAGAAVLVALALVLAVLLLGRRPELPAEVRRSVDAVVQTREALEQYRGRTGTYPRTLQELGDGLPAEARDLLERGRLRYEPADDLDSYSLFAGVAGSPRPLEGPAAGSPAGEAAPRPPVP